MSEQIDPKRFQRFGLNSCGGSKIKNWHSNIGEFLSRIWANYGPPDEVGYEGFSYCFRDNELDIFISVYSAGSGPAFGGNIRDSDTMSKIVPELEAKVNASISAFESILANSTPIDCEIEFDTDFGLYRAGARGGIPFQEPVETSEK